MELSINREALKQEYRDPRPHVGRIMAAVEARRSRIGNVKIRGMILNVSLQFESDFLREFRYELSSV